MTDDQQRPPLTPSQVRMLALSSALVLFGIAMVVARLAHAGAGTYPDWLAAFATLAAFSAALVAAWYAHRAFRLETQREARWVENQQRAQASLVAAWYDEKDYQSPFDPSRIGQMVRSTTYGAYVRNASDLPVNDGEVTAFVTQVRPDDPEPVVWTPVTHKIGLVPPTDEPHFHPMDELTNRINNVHEQHVLTVEIEFTFVDSTGIRWRRNTQGQLFDVEQNC